MPVNFVPLCAVPASHDAHPIAFTAAVAATTRPSSWITNEPVGIGVGATRNRGGSGIGMTRFSPPVPMTNATSFGPPIVHASHAAGTNSTGCGTPMTRRRVAKS